MASPKTTEYAINVLNNSGGTHNYALFSEKPEVYTVAASDILQYVLGITGPLHPGVPEQMASFQFYNDYYAFCGTGLGANTGGGTVSSSDWVYVQVSTNGKPGDDAFMTTLGTYPYITAHFDGTKFAADCTEPRAYAINCDTTFIYDNKSKRL